MLVDYSDSDTSGSESPKSTPVTSEPPKKPTSGLSGLLPKPKRRQKDAGASDGPKKIVVNLPKVDDPELLDQPPSKIRRVGGGGSGLSSMLPAPKKRKEAEAAAAATENEGTGVPRKPRVLGGASAGAREVGTVKMPGEGSDDEGVVETPKPAVVKGSNTMFVPQSVVAKKTIQPMSAFRKKGASGTTKGVKVAGANIAPPKPKVSLFGSAATSANSGTSFTTISSSGDYKPIMLDTAKPAPRPADSDVDMDTGLHDGDAAQQQTYVDSPPSRANDLDSLVEEVGLDEAAMRQLYGRRGRGKEPVMLSNFSVDEEYRQNEINRALGLAEEVKTVRAIQPGKHQLKSLLNAAQSQKSALEDSFAQAKRNRKEAGSKYGW